MSVRQFFDMAFVGWLNGNVVYPGWVSDDATVTCPKCESEMFVRGRRDSKMVRHFSHYSGEDSCSGESATHHRWKEIVYQSMYKLNLETVESFLTMEGDVSVSHTPSDVDRRTADVLLKLAKPNQYFGEGIAIEVQYRNAAKRYNTTTYDFLSAGYSVYWAYEDDFDEGEFSAYEMIVQATRSPHFYLVGDIALPEFEQVEQWDSKEIEGRLIGLQSNLSKYALFTPRGRVSDISNLLE